jgi:uncharacterized small protein (DUF1192 family)
MMKTITPSDFSLVVDGVSGDVAFVMSAAKDLKESRSKCLAAVLQAAKRLPAAIDSSVFFLGNSTRYSVKDLETRRAALLDENSRICAIACLKQKSRSLVGTAFFE